MALPQMFIESKIESWYSKFVPFLHSYIRVDSLGNPMNSSTWPDLFQHGLPLQPALSTELSEAPTSISRNFLQCQESSKNVKSPFHIIIDNRRNRQKLPFLYYFFYFYNTINF